MNQGHLQFLYILEVELPDQSSTKYPIVEELSAGLDPRNDVVLIAPHISSKHFHFLSKEDLLSVIVHSKEGRTTLNSLQLEPEKSYLLEVGDILKTGKIKIHIRRELTNVFPIDNSQHHFSDINSEVKLHSINHKEECEEKRVVKRKPKEIRVNNGSAFELIPYKIYGFLFDLALTYFFMTYFLAMSQKKELMQTLLFPLTNYFNTSLVSSYPLLGQYKVLSLFEFFVVFHLLMVTSSLILANTPGAFLVGLHPKKSSFLLNRFKAYLYSLINILVLPLLFLDIPLLKRRTLKECLTLHLRELSPSAIFKLTRRGLIPLILILSLLSPLFLPFPYNAIVTKTKLGMERFKDIHTYTINSISSTHGTFLKTEVHSDFSILPLLESKKIGFIFYDHRYAKSLVAKEEWRLKTTEALFKLRFANPFSSLYLPNEKLNNEALKDWTLKGLEVSPLRLTQSLKDFGLFFGNALLFKEELLKSISKADSFEAIAFNEKNPFLLLSSETENKLFWFTPKELICFDISLPHEDKERLMQNFKRDILSGMTFSQTWSEKLKKPEILEVLDAFERGNHQSILTYYIYEAKNLSNRDQAWQQFLKNNILQTKLALIGITTKNIERSLDDLIKSIQ